MRALLDVNVLIVLFDPDHAFHKRAHEWWAKNSEFGWASCPITENGVVRIMSNPGYSQKARFTPEDLISRLKVFPETLTTNFGLMISHCWTTKFLPPIAAIVLGK